MLLSPLQKRIIELSSAILATNDVDEFNRMATELKSALHTHIEGLRDMISKAKEQLATNDLPSATSDFPKPE